MLCDAGVVDGYPTLVPVEVDAALQEVFAESVEQRYAREVFDKKELAHLVHFEENVFSRGSYDEVEATEDDPEFLHYFETEIRYLWRQGIGLHFELMISPPPVQLSGCGLLREYLCRKKASSKHGKLAVLAIALLWLPARIGAATPPAAPALADPVALQGVWQRVEEGSLLRLDRERVVTYEKGRLEVAGVVRWEPGKVVLRRLGLLETWRLSTEEGILRVERPGKTLDYKLATMAFPVLDLAPFPLPAPKPLPAARIQEIQGDLATRLKNDQAALKTSGQPRAAEVVADNDTYLVPVLESRK